MAGGCQTMSEVDNRTVLEIDKQIPLLQTVEMFYLKLTTIENDLLDVKKAGIECIWIPIRFSLPASWNKKSLIITNKFLLISDILRGVEAVSEELHPSVHRHQELIPFHSLESLAESLRLFGH